MAKQVQLKAMARTETGKTQVKRLRGAGVVPGVVYGAKTSPLSITVKVDDLEAVLNHGGGSHVLVDLQVDEGGQTRRRLALVQDVQQHPVGQNILHVDFREVLATEKMRTTVRIHPMGEPVGVKTGGGVLEFVLRDLHVECLPTDLPEAIEIDVTALEIGQSIHVSDVKPPTGVTLLNPPGQAIFIVAAPIAEEEAATTAEGAPAEPEVIGAKKEEGGEGAAPADGKAEAKPAAGKADAKAAPAKAEAGKGDAKTAAPAAKPDAKKK